MPKCNRKAYILTTVGALLGLSCLPLGGANALPQSQEGTQDKPDKPDKPVSGVIQASGQPGSTEVVPGEPLLLHLQFRNDTGQDALIKPGEPGRQWLTLEVRREGAPGSSAPVAKWPLAPKASAPKRVALADQAGGRRIAPIMLEMPKTQYGSVIPAGLTWSMDKMVPVVTGSGAQLPPGDYRVLVRVNTPAWLGDEYRTANASRASPVNFSVGGFEFRLRVAPADPVRLARSARKLCAAAALATTSNSEVASIVETLLLYPKDIAYPACRSLAYDLRGDVPRVGALVGQLEGAAAAADTPEAVSLLGEVAWRMRDENAKAALARLYWKNKAAGQDQEAERIAGLFREHRASVERQPL